MFTPLRFLVLLAISTFSFSSFADKSPMTVEGATTVNAAEAKALFDSGVLFVDIRRNSDYEAG